MRIYMIALFVFSLFVAGCDTQKARERINTAVPYTNGERLMIWGAILYTMVVCHKPRNPKP